MYVHLFVLLFPPSNRKWSHPFRVLLSGYQNKHDQKKRKIHEKVFLFFLILVHFSHRLVKIISLKCLEKGFIRIFQCYQVDFASRFGFENYGNFSGDHILREVERNYYRLQLTMGSSIPLNFGGLVKWQKIKMLVFNWAKFRGSNGCHQG